MRALLSITCTLLISTTCFAASQFSASSNQHHHLHVQTQQNNIRGSGSDIRTAEIQPPLIALMYNYPELMTGNVVQQGEVSIWVESAQSIEDETLNYAFVGMPPSFKIHIAEGGSCDVVDDDMDIGYGPYWNANVMESNPWLGVALINSDVDGFAIGSFMFDNGYNLDNNFGHALVVLDEFGTLVACGVLLYNIPFAETL